jgi:hypothetical protein
MQLVTSGLSDCGRLQQFFKKHGVLPISELVSAATLDRLLDAGNLTEQRKCFDALPLQELKNILR